MFFKYFVFNFLLLETSYIPPLTDLVLPFICFWSFSSEPIFVYDYIVFRTFVSFSVTFYTQRSIVPALKNLQVLDRWWKFKKFLFSSFNFDKLICLTSLNCTSVLPSGLGTIFRYGWELTCRRFLFSKLFWTLFLFTETLFTGSQIVYILFDLLKANWNLLKYGCLSASKELILLLGADWSILTIKLIASGLNFFVILKIFGYSGFINIPSCFILSRAGCHAGRPQILQIQKSWSIFEELLNTSSPKYNSSIMAPIENTSTLRS